MSNSYFEMQTEKFKNPAGAVYAAIDSSLGSSVAVTNGNEIVQLSNPNPLAHAEVIGTLLQEAFSAAKVSPRAVTHVVQGVGPGPFTGLRIGLAAAQAFALGSDAKLLSVVSHDAVALDVLQNNPKQNLRVIQDAKRRELFVSEYQGLDADKIPVRVAGPKILARETLLEKPEDLWPTTVPAAALIKMAILLDVSEGEFTDPGALYLRAPDVNLLQAKA